MKTGAVRQFLNRIPWLLLLMLSATFTGAIIDSFEERLANISFLIAFIPMLMDTGGNCGSQASILVIRSLALGDIKGSEVLKVWWKEIRVALLCGIVLSAVNFIRVFVMKYYFSGGEYALLFVNLEEEFNEKMHVEFCDLGLTGELGYGLELHDIYDNKDLGSFKEGFTDLVPAKGCKIYRARLVKA